MFWIILSISLVGLFFSVFVLLIIYKKPSLHNAFGYLCAVHASAELIVLCCFSFWSAPLILINNPNLGSIIPGIIIGQAVNYFVYCALYFQCIKSFNRVFAILFFTQYRRFFTPSNVIIIVIVVMALCVLHVLPGFFYKCNFIFEAESYIWKVREQWCADTTFLYIDFGTGALSMIISIICDTITFGYLVTRKSSNSPESKSSFRREIKFYFQTCMTSLIYGALFASFHFFSRLAKTPIEVAISTTIVWISCHTLNQLCFIIFNVKFKKSTGKVQVMSTATELQRTTRLKSIP